MTTLATKKTRRTRKPTTAKRTANMDGITLAIETITPDEAKLRLDSTTVRNRPINQSWRAIAEVMNSGEFQLNGESIIHDKDGNILDGQHRYMACAQSGKPFTSVVVRGIPRSAFPTIDSSMKRTASHVLAMKGFAHTSQLAAAGLRVRAYRLNRLAPSTINGGKMVRGDNPPAYELAEYVESLGDDFVATAKWAKNSRSLAQGLKPLAPAFLVMIVHELGDREHLGREFFERVSSGAGLELNSPELALKNYLSSMLSLSPHRRAHGFVIASCAVKALNASLEGRELKTIRYNEKEGFPVIGGVPA